MWIGALDLKLCKLSKIGADRRRNQAKPQMSTYMKHIWRTCHDIVTTSSWLQSFSQLVGPDMIVCSNMLSNMLLTHALMLYWHWSGIAGTNHPTACLPYTNLVRMPCSFTKSKSAEPQLCNMSLRPWSLFELCLKRFAANTFIEWSYGAPADSFFSPKDLFLLSQFEQTSRERTWYLLPSRNFCDNIFILELKKGLQWIWNGMWCHSVVCFLCLAGQVPSLSQHHRALWRGRRHLKSFSQSKRPTPWIQLGGFFCPQSIVIVALCIAGVLSCGLQVSELEFSKAKTLMNQSRPTPPQPTPQLLPETQAETGTAGILTWWLEWLESLDLRSLQMISASHQVPSLAGGVLLNQHGVTWWSC